MKLNWISWGEVGAKQKPSVGGRSLKILRGRGAGLKSQNLRSKV